MSIEINDVCRLCISKEGLMLPIFDKSRIGAGKADLSTKISYVIGIEVSADDDLPTKACHNCILMIDKFYNFKSQCKSSNSMLLQYVKDNSKQQRESREPELYLTKEINNETDIQQNDDSSSEQDDERIQDVFDDNREVEDNSKADDMNDSLAQLLSPELQLKEEPIDIIEHGVQIEEIDQHYALDILNANFEIPLTEGNGDSLEHRYECSLCPLSFSCKYILTKHYKSHMDGDDSLTCPKCNQEFGNKSKLYRHLVMHSSKGYFPCHLCERSFSYKHSLNFHFLSHTGERPYECWECKKKFKSLQSLKLHMKYHNGDKSFVCPICSKSFIQKCHLNSHIRQHTGEKPYSCHICQKCFTNSFTLYGHMRVHTGERPFVCNICDKAFRYQSHLNNHIKIHTNSRSFVCDKCPKTFIQKINLTKHIETVHSAERIKPYYCKICNKSFCNKTHARVHTGEKPYNCQICNKSFSHSCSLTVHNRIHNGHKPFQCDRCNKLFSQRNHLKYHIKLCDKTYNLNEAYVTSELVTPFKSDIVRVD